ncbi:hypothetical protein ABIB62_003291 [Mucilaginibacter sp. UYP25]
MKPQIVTHKVHEYYKQKSPHNKRWEGSLILGLAKLTVYQFPEQGQSVCLSNPTRYRTMIQP